MRYEGVELQKQGALVWNSNETGHISISHYWDAPMYAISSQNEAKLYVLSAVYFDTMEPSLSRKDGVRTGVRRRKGHDFVLVNST
jgi:hypothetical protein